ncbi:hypothetical protein FB45DRAFT_40380 [Roridomyces roridus]|uniref:Uncharacterized protein n=1 Tax=Roridomyces roridus TaxID=1738132 RepID=A0AAD7BRH0_9AGAR|nr:hypothetical protein FB45DRAFT_40380 [Roridomyces roridus]
MPGIPKLLKKISRRNIRAESTEDAPPLPEYAEGRYSDFPLPPSQFHSARTSPVGSPRPQINRSASAFDLGYYELPPVPDFPGRRPSLNDSVESLPAPPRRPSHAASEYTRSSSQSRQPPYQNVNSPASPYSSPDGSSPHSRTMSHSSPVRRGGYYDMSPPSTGHSDRGRPGFVASPSQLAYAHVDLQVSYIESPESQFQTLPIEEKKDDSNQENVPPLPNENTQISYLVPDPNLDKPIPRLPDEPVAPQDDFSKDLHAAWVTANTAPKQTKVDKMLLTMETNIGHGMAVEVKQDTIVATIKTGLQTVGALDAIESGINSFMEGMPGLMKGLDEVAKLHPFIGVAVMAFKAVWALEQKRRDNDKKILALHMEMKDMMAVLTQLKNVKDAEEVAPDGSTIKGRMQEIVKATADDIKACANACDTYTKKKMVVKILKGPQWEGILVKFAGSFTKRRSEFEFALAIHTARGVDQANQTLGDVDKITQEMNTKMDIMMKMFQQLVPPEQKNIMRVVEQRGGLQACQDNDKVLKELSDLETKSSLHTGATQATKAGSNSSSALEDLKDELLSDVESAIEKNNQVFSRKLEVQKRQIVEEMSQIIAREGDRVISAITAGPHDRIIDPDVHKIWKDMGWRSSVKSRHFVMALADYYRENSEDADSSTTSGKPRNPDDWALAYLSVSRLQSISEAFDDDASGFITTAEANTFTTSRPLGWSLPHWIAFWAVGFHQTMSVYATKIRELIAKMFALRSLVLPPNRSAVNGYLEAIYQGVVSLESGLAPCYVNEALQEKFNSYIESEEARLRGNLEAVDYDLDAANTLALVTGQGRIERFALPVLYLLLQRDFERFRICQKTVLHPDEMWDASDTVGWVVSACEERTALLLASFSSQKADIGQEFKNYAHGMFRYMNEPSGLWDAKFVLAQEFPDYPYDDALEADIDVTKVLNYPVGLDKLDFAAYYTAAAPPAKPSTSPSRPSPALKPMLGTWNGFTYLRNSAVPDKGMISMDLVANGSRRFQASSRSNMTDFTITGECSSNSNEKSDTVSFSFVQKFPTRFSPLYFSGSFSRSQQSLSGTWGAESDARTHDGVFIFKRLDPEYMCFFPAPAVMAARGRSRALWVFAAQAARYAVRRDMWTWSLIKEKTDNRKRFIELYIRATRFGRPLARSEEEELGLVKKSFTTADSRFYHSIAENKIRVTTSHDVRCDACTGVIGGCRLTCLTCRLEETFDTVDFCDSQSCSTAKVVPSGMTRPHLPGTHDILKLRRPVHLREFGKTHREGKRALAKARTFFAGTEESDSGPRCAVCDTVVCQPCWYCVMCEEPNFICNACESDPKKKHAFGYHDMYSHDLVRCQPLVEEVEVTLEDLFANLEQRFIQHETNTEQCLKGLEAKVDERLAKVDSRLMQVEKLLERVLLALQQPCTKS